MGNCCSNPEKMPDKDQDKSSINHEATGTADPNLKEVLALDYQSDHMDSSKLEQDSRHGGGGGGAHGGKLLASQNSPTGMTPKTGGLTLSLGNPSSLPKIPSQHYISNRNNNNNNTSNMNGSLLESGSLNGYTSKPSGQQTLPQQYQGKDNQESIQLGEEMHSQYQQQQQHQSHIQQPRVDTQERELSILTDQHVVCTNEQLQNAAMQKFVFLCRSDSTKSFILHLPHTQTQQPGSMEQLFETASKLIMCAYGTPPVSLELLFGMCNPAKSLLSQIDAFPAYFKTKEIFEDMYTVPVLMPGNSGVSKKQQVFPSMTVEDFKIEVTKIDVNVQPNAVSVFRVAQTDEMITSTQKRVEIVETLLPNGQKQLLIPLQDQEKFGISDWSIVLRNADEGHHATSTDALYWPTNSDKSPEDHIPLSKKAEGDHRLVKAGLNVEVECKNSDCRFKGKKLVKSLGVGVFDFLGADSKLSCPNCAGSSAQIVIHQIAFLSCRFAYTGMAELQKKSAVKWSVAFQPAVLTRLEQKEVFQSNKASNGNWTAALASAKWTKFKVYTKRVSHATPMKYETNEELMHSLQIEANSSHKMCGVCKQNVTQQMQHTLDCGHAFHKICLNMLPQIFALIRCPLCR